MLKIKHKQTEEIQEISVYGWDRGRYNIDLWELINEADIVQLYMFNKKTGEWMKQHRMEYKDAMDLLRGSPNDYRFDALDHRPAHTPIQYPKIKAIYVSIIKFLKHEYIKIIVTSILVLLIWFFLEPVLKECFGVK